jgi:hypothetical protein
LWIPNGRFKHIPRLIGTFTNHFKTIIAIQTHLPPQTVPIGQALLIFLQTFGGAFFLAIGQTLFNSSLLEALRKYAPNVNIQAVINAGASGVHSIVSTQELPSVLKAYNESVDHEFYMSAAASAITLLTCLGMGWTKIAKNKPKDEATAVVEKKEASNEVSPA